MGILGYSKNSTSSLAQSKSTSILYDPRQADRKYNDITQQQRAKEWRQTLAKIKNQEGMKSLYDSKHSKITEQIKILKKIAANN